MTPTKSSMSYGIKYWNLKNIILPPQMSIGGPMRGCKERVLRNSFIRRIKHGWNGFAMGIVTPCTSILM